MSKPRRRAGTLHLAFRRLPDVVDPYKLFDIVGQLVDAGFTVERPKKSRLNVLDGERLVLAASRSFLGQTWSVSCIDGPRIEWEGP